MAFGRPRQPNDPSVMASLEAAMSTVARPRLIARMWPWRYEFGLIAGVLLGTIGIGVTLGPGWLIAAAAAMAVLAAALTWPPSRQRITARAWCVITPHRVRTGCAQAWIHTRDGHLPVVLYTVPAGFGELEVIRRLPPDSPEGGTSGWPYLDRGDASGAEPEEPALYNGLG
jgi:hypothetical protein